MNAQDSNVTHIYEFVTRKERARLIYTQVYNSIKMSLTQSDIRMSMDIRICNS